MSNRRQQLTLKCIRNDCTEITLRIFDTSLWCSGRRTAFSYAFLQPCFRTMCLFEIPNGFNPAKIPVLTEELELGLTSKIQWVLWSKISSEVPCSMLTFQQVIQRLLREMSALFCCTQVYVVPSQNPCSRRVLSRRWESRGLGPLQEEGTRAASPSERRAPRGRTLQCWSWAMALWNEHKRWEPWEGRDWRGLGRERLGFWFRSSLLHGQDPYGARREQKSLKNDTLKSSTESERGERSSFTSWSIQCLN